MFKCNVSQNIKAIFFLTFSTSGQCRSLISLDSWKSELVDRLSSDFRAQSVENRIETLFRCDRSSVVR